ncbi:MAG: hypothetical protein JWP69_2154 [Flaviaesturariibacter sp.]|nr:hypothetical protein [Flaviaesturariibacter sp.]
MKALRIMLILVGCSCIALNIGQIAMSETNPLPIDAGFLKIFEVYVSKLYLLLAGIVIAAIGSNIHAKNKNQQIA